MSGHKRIGILGGISPQSTLEYYRRLTEGYLQRTGGDRYPEIVIYSLDFRHFTALESGGPAYVDYIAQGVAALERAGAELALLAANSAHSVFPAVAARATIPLVSLVDATLAEAERLGLARLLLLGIGFTMKHRFYPDAARRLGIEIAVPSERDQDAVDEIVFSELTRGVFRDETRARLVDVMRRTPADGVILGCTELPLILRSADWNKPLLDTLDLHVRAVLDRASS